MVRFLFNDEMLEASQPKNKTCTSQISISRKKQHKTYILVRKTKKCHYLQIFKLSE